MLTDLPGDNILFMLQPVEDLSIEVRQNSRA